MMVQNLHGSRMKEFCEKANAEKRESNVGDSDFWHLLTFVPFLRQFLYNLVGTGEDIVATVDVDATKI